MPKIKFRLIHRDAFFCTLLTFAIAAILYGLFVNLSVLDPFEKAFKDFNFTDLFYAKKFKTEQRNDQIVLVNVKHADRFMIAQAIDKIAENKPKVIGLDIIFKEQRNAFSDSVLNAALSRHNNLVTSFYNERDSIVRNNPYFVHRPDKEGYINLDLQGQHTVIRDFIGVKQDSGTSFSFATQIAMQGGFIDREFALKKLSHRLPINYIGKRSSFLSFDIEEILGSGDIPALKDAIVLVGYLGDGPQPQFDIEDKHFTPMNEAWVGRSVPDTYGITIHANIIHMLTKGDFIKRLPKSIVFILAFLCSYLVVLMGIRIYRRSNFAYDVTVKIMQLLVSVVLLYLAFVALRYGLYINTAPILLLAILSIEMIEYYQYLISYLNKKFKWKSYLLES